MKVAIVYWSGTGNTEVMANHVATGVTNQGGEATLLTSAAFTDAQVNDFDAIAFGCPSMGSEVLEESEFQPMWDSVVRKLSGKKIALFGSYGWGDGEWMRNWEAECNDANANLVCDYVICNETPDDSAIEACKALGATLAK